MIFLDVVADEVSLDNRAIVRIDLARIPLLFDLTGQVAIVTGAAKGLGYMMAEVVAEYGGDVLLTDVDAEALRLATERLKLANSRSMHVHWTSMTWINCSARSTTAQRNSGVSTYFSQMPASRQVPAHFRQRAA